MRKVDKIKSNGFYLLESVASGRTCYFESEAEVKIFKSLFLRYMKDYVEIHHVNLSTEGYQILVKIREKRTLIKKYIQECESKGKTCKAIFLSEPWRIISEQVRKLLSIYARKANRIRGRKGVLVQKKYEKFIFDSIEELERYKSEKVEIESQRRRKYRVGKKWKKLVDWVKVRARIWGGSFMNKGFHDLVLPKLINDTISYHSPASNTT